MKPKAQETTDAEDKIGKLPRPDTGSIIARSAGLRWVSGESTGFSYKYLFEDLKSGQSTMLMKVEAGAISPPHVHDQLEQILIMEGDFYDEYSTYELGDFIVRSPGAKHTGGSKTGALLLLIYSE